MTQTNQIRNTLPEGFNFSQSSLQDYGECNRRFQLRYMEQLKWPAIETAPVLENERRQIEGQQFHRMVQQRLVGLPAEKLARMASSEALARWWQNWLDFYNAQKPARRYPEITLSAPVGKRRLVAKYDMISAADGRFSIFDWKTYRRRPGNEDMAARLQSKVYPALLTLAGAHLNDGREIDPDAVEMIYWYADFPTEPYRISYSAEKFRKDWDMLQQLAAEVEAKQSFPPTPNERKCAYCAYRSYCERGVEAGMDDDPEEMSLQVDVNLEQIQEIEF